MHTTVHNKRAEAMNANDVYIGRGSEWGNPFSSKPSSYDVVVVASNTEAILRYEEYLIDRLYREPALREEVAKLKGKRLFCYCKPAPCHGDVLALIASRF